MVPSGFFAQNMAVLRQFYPLLAEELEKAVDNEEENNNSVLKTEAAATGAPTLILNGIYIHSKRDPEREAHRLVESASGDGGGDGVNKRPALVLGFGLGYAAQALAHKLSGRPIIIVEKRPEVLKKALETRDLGAFFSSNRLAFVLGGDGSAVTGALSLLESPPGIRPLVIQNRALTENDREWYAGVEDRIAMWNTQANVNRATQKRFGKRWVKNLSKNLTAARDIPGISHLEGLLSGRGIPVFLAAAGPSLDEAGPILEEIYKRCLVVAVDTSYRFFLTRNIDPDFIVSIDPQYWNSRHLACHLACHSVSHFDGTPYTKANLEKTCLIAESAVYPSVLRHPSWETFLCSSFFPLGRFIEDRIGKKGALGTGGSVATSAWDFARFLGAERVWISGLDLSYPDQKTHYRGALFEEMSQAASCRFFPAETHSYRLLRDGQSFRARRQGGGSVLTDKRLVLYATWFESYFSKYPTVKNYSLFPSGLEIKGLETGPAGELLGLPERREEIDGLLKGQYENVEKDFFSEEAGKIRAEKYKNALETLLKGLEETENLAFDASKQAGITLSKVKMGHLENGEREKLLKKLDDANKAITNSEVKEISGFLFPETTNWEAEIAATTADPLVRHLEFSSRFYRALAEAVGITRRNITQRH